MLNHPVGKLFSSTSALTPMKPVSIQLEFQKWQGSCLPKQTANVCKCPIMHGKLSRALSLNIEGNGNCINSQDACFGKTKKLSTHIKRNTITRNYLLKETECQGHIKSLLHLLGWYLNQELTLSIQNQ